MSLLPVEGWIVVGGGGERLGYVKGCFHPLPYYFVAPRVGGWYRLAATKCLYGVEAPVALLEEESLLSPFEAARIALSRCSRGRVCRAFRGLYEELVSAAGEAGATGSLAFKADRAGDVDLVVYGYRRGWRAYRRLLEMRVRGVTVPFRGRGKGWSSGDYVLHVFFAERRVLQGFYMGVPYTVRIVACTKPSPCPPRRVVGRVAVEAVITGGESYYTPAVYSLEVVRGYHTSRLLMVTHRIRYQEIPPGTRVAVEGSLEEVCGVRAYISPDRGGRVSPLDSTPSP